MDAFRAISFVPTAHDSVVAFEMGSPEIMERRDSPARFEVDVTTIAPIAAIRHARLESFSRISARPCTTRAPLNPNPHNI